MNRCITRLDTWRTSLRLTVGEPMPERRLADYLSAEVSRMEAAISRFREDSEISEVNRNGGRWVSVSWYFLSLLSAALDAAAATGGLVDPLLGRHVDAAGYRTWRGDGSVSPQWPGVPFGRWQEIEITSTGEDPMVRIPPHTSLDLGATGKALLADHVVETLGRQGLTALADMGGDIRAAGGSEGWVLAVDVDPRMPGSTPFRTSDAGLATSGTDRRRWRHDGRWQHHIIDPRTGRPARSPWLSASVLAGTAGQANALSTAAVILAEEAPEWLERRGVDALLAGPDGTVLVGDWPREVTA